MENGLPVVISGVNHHYGEGALRRQVLFDVSVEVEPGEIVILTGPSGGGKTTLLTLIGGLRSVQEGSLKVLGRELKGAAEADLVQTRKSIGYIFQAHNLLNALTAGQNVEMTLALHGRLDGASRRARSVEALEAVGLGSRVDQYPDQLSGGQKQRVAIARALVTRPKIILADEPTASLDKKSGRDVVQIMHDLAKQQGCAVLLVTHDNRILDIADRIINLEDGRCSSFTDAVLAGTQRMFTMLAANNRKGELSERLAKLPVDHFVTLLEQVTQQFQHFLHLLDLSNQDAFESMLEQVLEAFTAKIGQILRADRATLFLVDQARGELWSKVAQSGEGKPIEIRMPITQGIAGKVVTTGTVLNIPDAYAEPLFNREVDARTGYLTRTILCVPIKNIDGAVFAVAQLLNKAGGVPFDAEDESRFRDLAASVGIILESWWRMSRVLQNQPEAETDSLHPSASAAASH